MSDVVYDAAIAGGGPAGCSAATTLARLGLRVVLCEAKSYPHDKVCGEFLSPECTTLLDRLGVLRDIQALNPAEITTFSITTPNAVRWEAQLPGTAWGVSRKALDAVLVHHACTRGVELREATTVTDIRGSLADGFTLETRSLHGQNKIKARTVIAAHGKRSVLDRTLNRGFLKHAQDYIGLKAHFRGEPLPGRIDLYTFPGGYCGLSETENGTANLGLLARIATLSRGQYGGRIDVHRFIGWVRSQNQRLAAWLDRAEMVSEEWISISQVPFVEKEPAVGDVLMTGDAAGLIAPLAGDGIAMALHSGQMAAQYIDAYLKGKLSAAELVRRYGRAWRRTFYARLRLTWALQSLMFQPRAASLGLQVLRAVPPLGEFLVRHTRDMGLRQGVVPF